ncbi:hypothetical protein M011DRAFT_468146 [Sporormia fimetaria CBS 119925]|uniref:Uncharacterized protein n=1 Tax=Sporormia fimetaria CBS 119925 TaxID=1340428 RepID=A0A6A6VAW5_9PLEO|nr:hypothetical protein M011DRAFT_468146 [Sporormia fimetaria CBS 119925]
MQFSVISAVLLMALPVALANPMPQPQPTPPRKCTKICAPSWEGLECGKGWYPWNFEGSQCWACCTNKVSA